MMSLIQIRLSHILATCVLLTFPLGSTAGLTANTSKTIQGTKPILSDALKAEIAADKFSLLGFTYNGTDYDGTNIHSLSGFSASFSPSTLLTSLTPTIRALATDEASDTDGDSNIYLQPKTVITQKLLDANNVDISARMDSFCDLLDSNPGPYQLTLNGDLLLQTQFGDPRAQELSVTQGVIGHQPQNTYSISIAPAVCYLQPELASNYGTSDPSIWKPTKGFLPQSDSQPSKNFPTTGFTSASFDMKIIGFNAQDANWDAQLMTGENVVAYVNPTAADTVNVLLYGQETLTGIVAAFAGPALINIENDVNNLTYRFEISQWFIYDRQGPVDFFNGLNNCISSQAYVRLPTRAELTNDTDSTGYTRAIGEGVLAEWGDPITYNPYYWDSSKPSWTIDTDPTIYGSHFSVLPSSGIVGSTNDDDSIFSTCVSR